MWKTKRVKIRVNDFNHVKINLVKWQHGKNKSGENETWAMRKITWKMNCVETNESCERITCERQINHVNINESWKKKSHVNQSH